MTSGGGSKVESIMGRARFDPGYDNRNPRNAGRLVGAKRPFKVKPIWAIRFHFDQQQRLGDLRDTEVPKRSAFMTLPPSPRCTPPLD